MANERDNLMFATNRFHGVDHDIRGLRCIHSRAIESNIWLPILFFRVR
jgi:hypothetical protein